MAGLNFCNLSHAKVAAVVQQDAWSWPRPRHRNAVNRNIIESTAPYLRPDPTQEDKVIWNLNQNGLYSAKCAWQALRVVFPVIPWYSSVWFPHHILFFG